MKTVSATFTVVLVALLLPSLVYSQEAKAPSYKDGDWWKVNFELKSGSPRDNCSWWYSEYLVKIEKGKSKIYGFDGLKQEEIDCPGIEAQVLGTGPNARDRLKFPLRIGKSWNSTFKRRGKKGRRRRGEPKHRGVGWEKVKTPKGEIEAFKISRTYEFVNRRGELRRFSRTYYYSPKVKAIILLKAKSHNRQRTFTLVDFNVSN